MKTHHFYQARRVATQANAAGGAVVIDITPATGQMLIVRHLTVRNSGNNSLYVEVMDEDNATHQALAAAAAAAGLNWSMPFSPATDDNSIADGSVASSMDLRVLQGQKLTVYQAGAGVQNDTLTVAVTIELIGINSDPTWSKARSTNESDVSLAASTISSTNANPVVLEA